VRQLFGQQGTVTVWLHMLLLPQPSAMSQVWVMYCGQTPLVTMPRDVTRMLVNVPADVTIWFVQQVVAVGRSNVQALLHDTVLFVGHTTTRPVPALTVTVKTHVAELPQLSVAVTCTVLTPTGKHVPDGGL
jgi:hypothetical protein